ncbi:hypothetical protein F5882DRAFT_444334 [Hyaloscypha sp. PMI_1271]|nr:hypothetical protein F5882DRAFT_444334 [Hyaloscypha sp. PMI_1271]
MFQESPGKLSRGRQPLFKSQDPPLRRREACVTRLNRSRPRSGTSTWQFANADGDSDSLYPTPPPFDFELYLSSRPPSPELSENLTQATIDPRILDLSNTLGTGFGDGQLQPPRASTRPPPPTSSPPQEYFWEGPSQDSYPRQPQTTSPSETDHRSQTSRLSSPPAAQNSFALLSEPTSSLSTNSLRRLRMVLLILEIRPASEAMQGAFDPEGTSANGPDASTSSPSGRTSTDTRSRMLSPIKSTTTGVQILNAIKASHVQIIANDMPNTAERLKEHNSSNTLSLLDYTLDCLRDFYLPGLALLKHDIYSELSCEDSRLISSSRFFYTFGLFDDIERVKVLRRSLNDVEQTLQGFQLLKIRINEADYSTPLAYTVKLMGEWLGEEYATTCILKYIFDECVPRFRFHYRFFIKFGRGLFRRTYVRFKYVDILRTPPKISCTLPFFTYREAPTHDQLFNTTWLDARDRTPVPSLTKSSVRPLSRIGLVGQLQVYLLIGN